MAAFQGRFSRGYVLVRIIKNWRKTLDNSLFKAAILMDLSHAIDCIPQDLLIAKLNTYGLMFDIKQNVKINNICSTLLKIFSGVHKNQF